MAAAHLKYWEEYGVIYCIIIELAFAIFKRFFFNLIEKICPSCSNMTVVMFCLAKRVIFDNIWWILRRYPYLKIGISFRLYMIGVYWQSPILLIKRIDYFQHLLPHQLIIPIDNCHDFSSLAIVISSWIYIRHMILSLFIRNELHFGASIFILFELILQHLFISILRSIIDDNHMIVIVILLKDGKKIHEIPIFDLVLVAGDD